MRAWVGGGTLLRIFRKVYSGNKNTPCGVLLIAKLNLAGFDGILEGLAGFESRHFGGRDFDGLASLGINAITGGAMSNHEVAESSDGDIFALAKAGDNDVNQGVDHFVGLRARNVELDA